METHEGATDFISGRRSFDRQMEMLTIAVHTLQRDFAALDERVKAVHGSAIALSASIHDVEDELHTLDKALVTRLATITVTERVLWALAMAVLGLGVHFLG